MQVGRALARRIYFRTCRADRRRRTGNPYLGQVDAFAVYCAQLHRAYLIPMANLLVKQLTAIRLKPPANGPAQSTRWAQPYELSD